MRQPLLIPRDSLLGVGDLQEHAHGHHPAVGLLVRRAYARRSECVRWNARSEHRSVECPWLLAMSRTRALPLRAYCLMQCRAGMPHRGTQCLQLLGTAIAHSRLMVDADESVWSLNKNARTQLGFLDSDDFSGYYSNWEVWQRLGHVWILAQCSVKEWHKSNQTLFLCFQLYAILVTLAL